MLWRLYFFDDPDGACADPSGCDGKRGQAVDRASGQYDAPAGGDHKDRVILFISYELCRLGRKAYTMEGIIRVLALGAVASGGVLFLTDNLSTAIIVMAITCILIFVIHPKTKPFLAVIGAGAAVAAVGIAILSVTVANSDNFRLQRIISWLNPEATMDTGSYQVMQGLYAIGSGGFFRKRAWK